MLRFVVGTICALIFASIAHAQVRSDSPKFDWRALKIGGGGQLVQFNVSSDGTVIVRSDSAYPFVLRRGASTWSALPTSTSLPPQIYTALKTSGTSTPFSTSSKDTYDSAIAPSNSDYIYIIWQGFLLRSVDN